MMVLHISLMREVWMAKMEIPESISPSAPQMDRLGRIKAGCRKEYGDRHHTADEILMVIKKYKLSEKQWRKRIKAKD